MKYYILMIVRNKELYSDYIDYTGSEAGVRAVSRMKSSCRETGRAVGRSVGGRVPPLRHHGETTGKSGDGQVPPNLLGWPMSCLIVVGRT